MLESPKNNIKNYFHNRTNIQSEVEITRKDEDGYSRPATKTNQTLEVPVTNSGKNNFNQSESSNQSDLTAEKIINPNQLSIGAKYQVKTRPGHNMNEN